MNISDNSNDPFIERGRFKYNVTYIYENGTITMMLQNPV